MTHRVAITGGIAEGKSTVLADIAGLGLPTFSADRVASEVFADPETQRELEAVLGKELIQDRAGLRAAMAADPSVRRGLNRVLHPRILRRLEALGPGFYEVPLLIETALGSRFDRIWVVTCGSAEQRARLIARVGEAEAAALLRTQLPSRAKCAFADRILRTNAPVESVRRSVWEAIANDFPGCIAEPE